MQVSFPFMLDGRGRVADALHVDHIRQLIEQVLFTAPGERVNRPDFGCGLKQMVFLPNSDALAAATQVLVQGAPQRWLERVIQVERVAVEVSEASGDDVSVRGALQSGDRVAVRGAEALDDGERVAVQSET